MEYPFTASPFKPKLDMDKFRGQGRGRAGPNHHRGRGGHFGGPPGGGQLKLTPGFQQFKLCLFLEHVDSDHINICIHFFQRNII